jgi:hypothetical protein
MQRENKLELTRILLPLPDGTLRRICSFSNPKDKRGDPYVKLVFPDLHGQPLERTMQNSRWEIQDTEIAPDGMSEFSYHYKGGIAHFKDALSSHIDQDWIVPNIQKSPCLHLLRFLIFNLQWSNTFPAFKVSSRDFVIPRPFDGRARCIEFWISTNEVKAVADSEEEEVQTYKFQLDDQGHSMYVTDGYWIKPHLISPDSSFEIFRFDNPTALVTLASSTAGDVADPT